MTTRLAKLKNSLQQSSFDAIVLNPGPMLSYLTGLKFHLMERPVVMLFTSEGQNAIVLPELEKLKLANLAFPVNAFAYSETLSEWPQAFYHAIQALNLDGKVIGVEPRRLRLLEFNFIQSAAPKAEFPDASIMLSSLRILKDTEEISAMQHAVQVAQNALDKTIRIVKVGMTEKELASELTLQLLRHGSEPDIPFSPIVASGLNSANPHAVPGIRKLTYGDLLLIDWGATVGGYVSDLTRTFAIGEVDSELETIHKTVLQANTAARAAVRPGATAGSIDKEARRIIEAAGYGQYFTHRTGHGIGLEGHEEPYIRSDNMQILEPGMAFTIEPGIYLPGRGGVRIEDNMIVTEAGTLSLSNYDRSMVRIG